MRILFVGSNIESPGANGGSTHVTEVVRHLREQDEVLLIARRDSTLPQTLAIGSKTPISGLRRLNALRLALRAYPEVKRFAPDVIYERGSAYGLGALLGRSLAVPTLMMVLDEQHTRLSLRTARRLIATRQDVVPKAYRHKLRLVRWGANTQMFDPGVDGTRVRTRWNIDPNALVVGYTGAFYGWHGLEELVEAARSLVDLPVVFLLVGQGERSDAIRKLVVRHGLQARFIFTGRVAYDEIPSYIAASDVCVAPYNPARHGHFERTGEFVYDPLKLFEYMASAKAVLTLRASNIEEMFEDGRELMMMSPGDAIELARKLRELLQDAELRQRLGRAAREAVVTRYTWAAHANQLRSMFNEIIEEHRTVRAP